MMNTRTALLLIDIQRDVLHGVGENHDRFTVIEEAFEATIHRLVIVKNKACSADIPVIIIQHAGSKGHRLETGTEGWKIHPLLGPNDKDLVISKTTSDSFHNTELLLTLQAMEINHLLVGGFMTQYCVDLSVRRAVTLGFDVTLISDGHSTCDIGGLSYEQIIAHHNNILPVFKLNGHGINLLPSNLISFNKN
ncbi:cysteine hydrolase family protein [Klebsiella quasivariicola]|uniref:cysteine hydrolase family protein n=1 Tax=Klebsiella quasivariicola TaxID=2026240 RepID=UPI00247AE756|nr:cysteine hydrolase family protein [Klebsiella quasivariicola]